MFISIHKQFDLEHDFNNEFVKELMNLIIIKFDSIIRAQTSSIMVFNHMFVNSFTNKFDNYCWRPISLVE